MKSGILAVTASAVLLAGSVAHAQLTLTPDTINGSAVYVTGSGELGNFGPGVNGAVGSTDPETLRLYDDGVTNGDATAGDGIYTCVVSGLTSGNQEQWKVSTPGFSTTTPTGTDNYVVDIPVSGTVTFTLNTNEQNDGFIPDVGSDAAPLGIAQTDTTTIIDIVTGATSIAAVGAFQSELGGSDWDGADTTYSLTDDGVAPDVTSGDGIYTLELTGLPAGAYEYKVLLDGSFGSPADFGNPGFATGGGNLAFAVIDPTDTITIETDANTGRTRSSNDNVLAQPGPPFFAQSSAWSTGFTSAEELNDEGDGTFQKVFTVATAGTYSVRVRQGIGDPFPVTGDYPFTTATAGQTVRVVLDRNTYTDGYIPTTDFVVVLDEVTRADLNNWDKVQPVGQWQDEFGAGGEWDAAVAAMDAADDGVAPDVAAGDSIFTVELTELNGTSFTGQAWKFVGQRTGEGDTGFDVQLGGSTDGLTLSGNNANGFFDSQANTAFTFVADTVTGRVAVGPSSSPPGLPDRSASYFTPGPTSVETWDMY